jgi:tetratricopeptide (TPR) repeat protein
MESAENPYKLLSALYRLGLVAIIGALLMVPGFFVGHLAGDTSAVVGWGITLGWIVWVMLRQGYQEEENVWAALTATRPDVGDKPPLVFMLFGAVFAAGGVAVWLTDMQHPEQGPPTSPVLQRVFGAVFFGTGGGLFVMGATAGLIRRGLRREMANLQQRIAMRPDSAALQLELAAMLADQGSCEDAIPALDKAIELDPRCVEAHVERGRAHWIGDRYDAAIADLTRAIELDPRNAEAYSLRSMAYEDSDQPELAKADEERGMELEEE